MSPAGLASLLVLLACNCARPNDAYEAEVTDGGAGQTDGGVLDQGRDRPGVDADVDFAAEVPGDVGAGGADGQDGPAGSRDSPGQSDTPVGWDGSRDGPEGMEALPPADGPVGPEVGGPIPAGLVLHWRLDEGAGLQAIDSSGNQRHGTYLGTTPPAPATAAAPTSFVNAGSRLFTASVGQSVRLDNAPPALRPASGLTVAVWFRSTRTDRSDLVCHGSDYFIRLAPGTLEFVRLRPPGSSSIHVSASGAAPTAHDGRWHHAAGVANASGTSVFLDGIRINRDTSTLPMTYQSNVLVVGRSAAGNQNFEGWLDDVRIYDRPLSDAEVLALARGGP